MNTAADAKRLADEFLVGNTKQAEPTKLVADLLQQPQLPASISTEQLNELLVRYMLETNQHPRMDLTSFAAITSTPTTSTSVSQFNSIVSDEAYKLLMLSQTNQSPQLSSADTNHCDPYYSTLTSNSGADKQCFTALLNVCDYIPNTETPLNIPNPFIEKPAALTRDVMMDYLRDPNRYDCIIQIFHARVAQKSYGNEKRFFCPPPCVYLYGGGWSRKREQFRQLLRTANPQLSHIQPPANMHAELQKADPRVHIGIQALRDDQGVAGGEQLVPWTNEPQELDFSNGKDYCAAKTLFISDSEKTKFFKLFVQISFMSGQEIGTFLSERIKVISKPSKKKQQMKSNECSYLCITSGKKVALFHRLRSQTVSTRYLHVADQQFRASSSKWGAFTIHLIDEEKSPVDTPDFHTKEGYIYYGAVVKLVDTNSGISLPRLRIRKVGNSNIISEVLTLDEPVSQLHKCAFQFMDDKMLYLSLVGDQIAQHSADIINGNQHQVSEGMAWTIISTEKVEYRFYEAMGPTWQPVTPAPIVENITFDSDAISVTGYDTSSLTLSLRGRNFNPDLKVWFATHQCKTTYRSAELLDCDIPKLDQLRQYPGVFDVCEVQRDSVEVPIFLVRDDGVIYSTCMTFTYLNVQTK